MRLMGEDSKSTQAARRNDWAYAPRSFSLDPEMFGKTSHALEVVDHRTEDTHRVQAAELQHLVADAVRRGMRMQLRKFLTRHGPRVPALSYYRLVRMQRGEVQMQIADVLLWASLFPEVKTVIADYMDALPSTSLT